MSGTKPLGEHIPKFPVTGAVEGHALALKNATIGILTALPEEFHAVCIILGCDHELVADRAGAGRIYKLGVIRHRGGQAAHIVAVSQLLDMGNNNAAVGATLLLQDCPAVTNVIMCGIAGGAPNPARPVDHVRLGDIVVSGVEGVRQYDFVKEREGAIENRARPRPPSAELLEAARLLQAEELGERRPWDAYIADAVASLGADWDRPAPGTDVLREPNGKDLVRRGINGAARALGRNGMLLRYPVVAHPYSDAAVPRVFHGLIASANNLQKNPFRRNQLRDQYGAKAIEMEGSGVADAAYQLTIPYFVVRGICDYCNEDKNDVWHRYAALVAAAYARALLEAAPPRFLAATAAVPVRPPEVPAAQPANALEGSAVVQRVVVNTLIQDREAAFDLRGESGGVGGRGIASITNVDIPPISGDQVAGVQVNVSISFTSRPNPNVAPEAGISAGFKKTDLAAGSGSVQDIPASPAAPPSSELERQLLGEQAKRYVQEMSSLLSNWEFARLFEVAVKAQRWIEQYGDHLVLADRRELYTQLARVEVVNARQHPGANGRSDFTKARDFLRKAQDAWH